MSSKSKIGQPMTKMVSFERFAGLFGACTNEDLVRVWFDRLSKEYSQPGRHYHNLSHIAHCLQKFDEIAEKLTDPLSVELAIWFHDVIYDPKQADNEEQSAKFAVECLRELEVDDLIVTNVAKLILTTKHPSRPTTKDELYLVDIDLSILGATQTEYDEYESAIRKEYAHVPENDFLKGRYDLLNQFLNKDRIYETSHFRDRLEGQAQKNLVRAMRTLGSKAYGLQAIPAWRLAIYLGFYAGGLYVAGELMGGNPYELIAYGFGALLFMLVIFYLKGRHVETKQSRTVMTAGKLALAILTLAGIMTKCSG